MFKDKRRHFICNEWALAFLIESGFGLVDDNRSSDPNELYDRVWGVVKGGA